MSGAHKGNLAMHLYSSAPLYTYNCHNTTYTYSSITKILWLQLYAGSIDTLNFELWLHAWNVIGTGTDLDLYSLFIVAPCTQYAKINPWWNMSINHVTDIYKLIILSVKSFQHTCVLMTWYFTCKMKEARQ